MFPRFDKLIAAENEANAAALAAYGFEAPESAARALTRIHGIWLSSRSGALHQAGRIRQTTEPGWYGSLQRVLIEAPLRDTVLTVVEQFARNAAEYFDPFELFEQTPRALDILGRIACGSPFLTQTLLADPICLTSLTARGRTAEMKPREQFVQEAMAAVLPISGRLSRLKELRRFQRRELLRIGMCDAFGLMDLRFVTLQLSLLADAMVQVCLDLAAEECGEPADSLAVIALGKHGGEELNYSSDIDLVLIADRHTAGVQRLARLTIDGLAENLPPGFLYRVDLRLRPWGDAGPLVSTVESYAEYLRNDAALWEKQALLKARTVAGAAAIGRRFLESIRPLLFLESAQQVRTSIQQMKERIEQRLRQRGKLNSEVKLGVGSIRDVEFLVQCLQLTHGRAEPRILSCNTLDSLVRLAEFGLLDAAWYRQLRAGYVFLRTVEHSLQLLHNQQTHELPADPRQREWLAHRLDYPDAATLLQRFEEHRRAVRAIFESCLQVRPRAESLPAGLTSADQTAAVGGLSGAAGGLSTERSGGPGERGGTHPDELARQQRLIDRLAASVSESGAAGSGLCVAVHCEPAAGAVDELTLMMCGVPCSGWLSIICGLLAIYRLDIRRGEALTGGGLNRYGQRCPHDRFLAYFCVRPEAGEAAADRMPRELAEQLQTEVTACCQQVLAGQIEAVGAELISRFCDTVRPQPVGTVELADMELRVGQNSATGATLLNITGTDTPGFLFELAHALFFSRFRIARAIIDSDADQVRDILHVTEKNGAAVDSEARLQELRTVIVLIKQFTCWLPTTSDPHRALVRFRELLTRLQPASQWSENVESLKRPNVLHAVARVLGISQYLWEDFLRSRHEELFPLLANASELQERIPRPLLEQQLDEATASAASCAAALQALNAFKDRHLFRIDMRHVLGYCRPFGVFSEEITELAEIVVRKALQLAWEQLSAEHGIPQRIVDEGGGPAGEQAVPCAFAVAGLGKFGGTEMGYASDIELMLVYEAAGRTAGPQSISNARFFDQLVGSLASGISARQDGIFHVDLRMRPYGQAGSAAVALQDFEAYYRTDGPAWPYERQALVKLRCVAGDPQFAARVTDVCQRTVYAAGQFDFAAMRAMRERQIRQLVRGGTINAKLSDGGLVDCEYAVQALQLTFGRDLPTLRHANTRHVLQEAARLSLIAPEQSREVEEAYVFLRELIDCLRMVRGNARDLTVPDAGTPDAQQLARRMQTIHDSRIPLDQLERQMAIVRQFSRDVEQHCRLMRGRQAAS